MLMIRIRMKDNVGILWYCTAKGVLVHWKCDCCWEQYMIDTFTKGIGRSLSIRAVSKDWAHVLQTHSSGPSGGFATWPRFFPMKVSCIIYSDRSLELQCLDLNIFWRINQFSEKSIHATNAFGFHFPAWPLHATLRPVAHSLLDERTCASLALAAKELPGKTKSKATKWNRNNIKYKLSCLSTTPKCHAAQKHAAPLASSNWSQFYGELNAGQSVLPGAPNAFEEKYPRSFVLL